MKQPETWAEGPLKEEKSYYFKGMTSHISVCNICKPLTFGGRKGELCKPEITSLNGIYGGLRVGGLVQEKLVHVPKYSRWHYRKRTLCKNSASKAKLKPGQKLNGKLCQSHSQISKKKKRKERKNEKKRGLGITKSLFLEWPSQNPYLSSKENVCAV